MSEPNIERDYYVSGQLRAERAYVDGLPHGLHRTWHENGAPASEGECRQGNPEGVHRQWNDQGDLICEYEIKNGTGIQRQWNPNLEVWCEISWVDGQWTGRLRTTWENGEVLADQYWIRNERISKRRYRQACEEDPSLPQYND